jgi:hypothetical protein
MQAFQPFKNASATQLGLTTGDRRKLIDDITNALGIGGWGCGDGWDVSDEDIEQEWEMLERGADAAGAEDAMSAYHVALLIATRWERDCVMSEVQ